MGTKKPPVTFNFKTGEYNFRLTADEIESPLSYESMDARQKAFLAQQGFVNGPITPELDGLSPVIKALREAGLEIEECPEGDIRINGRMVRFSGRN